MLILEPVVLNMLTAIKVTHQSLVLSNQGGEMIRILDRYIKQS